MLLNDSTGRIAARYFAAALIVMCTLFSGLPPAEAKVKFSAIAIDARTGKVLFDKDADGLRHPASLTKVMTLYLLFEDLKAGKLSLDSKLRVSKNAANMAPSKLGLKPGATISVENAIKALVTKSANDIAATIAENLEGSESAFAARMTRTAKGLGMSRTVFKNASGLPNPAQVTTARDMATLSLRVQRDFPVYYPYFKLSSFTYNGRTIRTHNRLLGRFEGTDGIKTGYIRASGFNLTASARRGNRRIVGVVMGGRSGGARDTYMKQMLENTFPNCVEGKTIAALAGSSKGVIEVESQQAAVETPAANPAKPAKTVVAKLEDASPESTGSVFETVIAGEPKVIEGQLGEPQSPESLPFEVKSEGDSEAALQAPSEIAANWHIQIGAFPNKRDAQKRLQKVRATALILKDKTAFTVTVQKGQDTIYRARFSGFSKQDAKDACAALSSQNVSCLALPPQS